MRKIVPLIVVGILVLSGLGAVAGTESEKEKIKSETIFFSQPIISEKEDYISLELSEATSNSMEKDKPMLPVVSKVYTFPFGTHVDNVDVTFSEIVEKEISKPIMPSPEPQIVSNSVSHDVIKREKVLTYSEIDIYPEHRYGYRTGAGLEDGENVVYLAVSLYPEQYNPKENTIYHATKVTVDIKYTPPKEPIIFPDEYDLLIITPTQFKSTLQTLVDYKNGLKEQVKTTMVTLDNIPSQGVDEQEDIKYYIRDAKENWGINYVLLVGAGLEGQELFPVRYAEIGDPPHEDNFPCDLYYADIYDGAGGFPNWDYDGDGLYAEWSVDIPNVDVLPDVYLGRLPCNDVNELNTVVDKIIYYKDHNLMTKKILQVGGDTFPGNSQMEGEYANEEVLEEMPGYTSIRLWGSNGKLTKSNIADGFNKNVDFCDFSGHGSYGSWATHPPNDKHTWIPPKEGLSQYTGWLYFDFDIFNVKNNLKYPVVVYNSCSNNKFTVSENSLGWKTLSTSGGGGIAAYAAAGIGYGSPGHETARFMGWMEVHAFEELYNTKVLGQVWANCVKDYYNAFSTLSREDYKTMLEFCMFGDPSLAAENGEDPRNVSVNKPVFPEIFEKFIDYFPRLAKLFQLLLAKIS